MKKLEILGSKLFEEFKGDEVSELASVVGGVVVNTWVNREGCNEKDSETYGTTLKNGKEVSYKCSGDKTNNLDDVVYHDVAYSGSGYVGIVPDVMGEHGNVSNSSTGDSVLADGFTAFG